MGGSIMAKSFKVGEAPWEKEETSAKSFKVGEAPWEQEESEGFTAKGLLKGTLESLPMAGSLFGGAVGTAAGPIGTIGGAALGAGAGKALENIGEKYLLGEEKTRPEIYIGPAVETLKGAAAEMGGQLIGPAAKNIQESAAKSLEKISNTQAFKQTGAMLKDFRQASDKGMVDKLGKFIKENNLAPVGSSFETVAKRANDLRKQAGAKLDQIYSSAVETAPQFLERQTGFNPVRDRNEIISTVKDALKNKEGAGKAVSRLETYLDELAENYGNIVLDPKTANEIKGSIDDVINYSRNPLSKEPITEIAFSKTRGLLEKKIAKDVDFLGEQIGNKEFAQALRDANKEYGYSTQINKIAFDRINRENANKLFGLTDTIAGSAAATMGALKGGVPEAAIYGLGGALANKAINRFGPGLISRGAGLGAKMSRGLSPELIKQVPKGLLRGD